MRVLLDLGQQLYRSAHARNAAGYFAANIIAALVPFLLLPLLTRLMQPEAYGRYSLYLLVVSASMPLVSLTLSSVVSREYTLRKPEVFARFFSTCAALSALALLLTLLLSLLLRSRLEALVHLSLPWVLLGVASSSVHGLLMVMYGLSAMQKKPFMYAALRTGFAIAGGVAAFVAVLLLRGSWQQLILSQGVVALLTVMLAIAVAVKNRWLVWAFSLKDAKLALSYSMPLVVHALTAGVILQTADRFFVARYLGVAEAGAYHVAQQVSLAMYVLVNTMQLVWTPWYYGQMKKNDHASRQRIVLCTYAGFAAMAVAGALLSAVLWLLFPYLVGHAFLPARNIFPWLVLGFVLNGMYVLLVTGMFYSGHTLQLMCCNVALAVLNVLLNIWLVPLHGMYGAAAATVLTTFCMLIAVWVMTMRLHGLPWLLKTPAIPE